MKTAARPQWIVYLLAVMFSVLTLAGRIGLSSWVGDRPLLILFVLPIILSAYLGGLGPGLVATAIVALGTDYFLIPSIHTFMIDRSVDAVQWLILILVGVLISIITAASRKKFLPADDAMRRGDFSTERKVRMGFAFALTCLAVIGVISFASVTRLSEEADHARHTEEVIAALHLLLSTTTDVETAQRGYVITGDERFLQPYLDARRQIEADLDNVRKLTADNARQQRQLDLLKPAVMERISESAKTVELRRSQGFIAAQAATATGRGKMLHDRIRGILAGMEATEKSLLQERESSVQHTSIITRTVIAVGSALGFAFVAVALFAIQRDFAGSRYAEAALKEANEQLEARVGERTEALGRSEARLGGIVGSAMDAIISVNREQTIVLFNQAAEKLFRCAAAAAVGQPLERFIPQRFRADHRRHVEGFGKTGVTARSTRSLGALTGLRADGGEFPMEASISQIEVAGEKIYTVILRDVTERKEAETARRASEARYSAIFDNAPDGIVIADSKSYYLDANASICRMLGYTRNELIGLHASDIVLPTEVKNIGPALEAIKTKSNYHSDWQFRRKDGSGFTAEVIATVMPDGNLLGMIRDSTERRRTEQALRESEERFHFLNDLSEATRTLADPNRIMAVMTRMLGEHLRASRCAYADVEKDGEQFTILHDYTDGCASTVGNYRLSLFGPRAVRTLYSGQTLIIRSVEAELLPGEGADTFNAIGIKAIITCPLVKDGGLRAMMAVHQTTPRDWKPDEIVVVRDVVERCWATIERRTAEEKIHQLNTELEQRVTERTAQLEAANKELEAFSYSVSHDLRAPLRAVNGFAGIVIEEFGPQLPAEAQRYLDRIRNGSQQMGVLIDDLLAFSRLSRQSLRRQRIDTAKLVQNVLVDLAPQHEGRRVEIQTGALPDSWGDMALLKQVWINLLSNAIKYTRGREPAVIEIGSVPDDGEDVYYVRDNGAGFSMQYAHKLFGVFQRLHTTDEFEGTGVGLAIVQRIVNRHGGRVWAEAVEGRGAIFRFTLGKEKPS